MLYVPSPSEFHLSSIQSARLWGKQQRLMKREQLVFPEGLLGPAIKCEGFTIFYLTLTCLTFINM